MAGPAIVMAAGGAVWRRTPQGLEVVLVHRPAYDDWGLPKGKLEEGESPEQAALREVEEETGLRCRLGGELPTTTYNDGEGRSKLVRYWAMTQAGGELAAAHEVDDTRWVPLEKARRRLTYPRDFVVLDALVEMVP
jgi:8-oxo-dGTP pyrophosphatase MutT (NUDIX family)